MGGIGTQLGRFGINVGPAYDCVKIAKNSKGEVWWLVAFAVQPLVHCTRCWCFFIYFFIIVYAEAQLAKS